MTAIWRLLGILNTITQYPTTQLFLELWIQCSLLARVWLGTSLLPTVSYSRPEWVMKSCYPLRHKPAQLMVSMSVCPLLTLNPESFYNLSSRDNVSQSNESLLFFHFLFSDPDFPWVTVKRLGRTQQTKKPIFMRVLRAELSFSLDKKSAASG